MKSFIVFIFLSALLESSLFAQEQKPETSKTAAPDVKVINTYSCPFRRDSSSVDNLVKQAKSALQNLADKDSKCPATKKIADQLDKNLGEVLEYTKRNNESRTNLDTDHISCENFEESMKSEFDFVINQNQLKNTSWVQSNVMRYSQCSNQGADGDPFEVCASKVYRAELNKAWTKCSRQQYFYRDKNSNKFQQSVLKDLATNAKILLENSKQCQGDSQTSKFVIQSVLGTVSSLGYLASGPLTGTAVALTGDLLSSFVQRFFQDKSPSALVDYIDAEYQFEELNCLYYELQNRSLACNNIINKIAPIACDRNTQFFYLASSLSQIEAVIQKESSQESIVHELDRLNSLFRTGWYNEINDPETGEVIETRHLLKKIAGDDFPAEELWKVSQEISGAYRDPNSSPEDKKKAILKLLSPMQESLKRKSKTGESYTELLKRKAKDYWTANGKGSEYEKNIKAMFGNHGNFVGDTAYLLLDDKAIKELVDTSGAQNKLDIAHSAFLNGYKKQFEKRLETLAERFDKNHKFQSNDDSSLDIIPMLQMCSLNASIFYFDSTDMVQKARNNISSRPSSTYRDVCSMFKCHVPMFDLSKFPMEKKPQEFRHYQCSMPFKYPEAVDKIIKNMKNTGKPCP